MTILSHQPDFANPHIEKAWRYGEEDALNGVESRAGEYFIVGGACWDAYHLAYLASTMKVANVKRLAGGSQQRYVMFQQPAEDYCNVRASEDRDDYIGA